MKNFIQFLYAEFNADFKKNIFVKLWTVFDTDIIFFSDVEQNSFYYLQKAPNCLL